MNEDLIVMPVADGKVILHGSDLVRRFRSELNKQRSVEILVADAVFKTGIRIDPALFKFGHEIFLCGLGRRCVFIL